MNLKFNQFISFIIIAIQFLFSTTLTIGNGSVNAGETVEIEIILNNPDDVIGGFQFTLNDAPDQLQILDMLPTDRTDHLMIQFAAETNTVVAFDLNGIGIDVGMGPILSVIFESTGIYTNTILLNMVNAFLSDLVGNEVVFDLVVGSVEVSGEEPPPIFSPEGLTVVGGFQSASLSWTHPDPDAVIGYRVYRDGNLVGDADIANYMDTGLETLVEYCYTVTAYDENVESDPSAESCALTIEQNFEVPLNLTASVDGLEATLDWDTPEGFTMIAGECEGCGDYYGQCIYDCILQCVSATTVGFWTGDGLCDDGSWGIYLNCDEFECDGGDCDCGDNGAGENNENSAEVDLSAKEYYQGAVPPLREELLGYEVYRNNQALEYVENTGYIDNSGLEYLETYCYNVTAVYDEGTSGYSNTACIDTELSPPQELTAFPGPGQINLSWQPHPDNEQNEFYIYKDGVFLTSTIGIEYIDDDVAHATQYCYQVSAMYDLGESGFSNTACTQWDLMVATGLTAEAGDATVHLEWYEPGSNLCADEVIGQLPFNAIGSNVGAGDDWLVQGGQGADYSYMLTVNSTTVIDVTLCSMITDYDTKLEIFTSDTDCNETSTGYYIDDDGTCTDYNPDAGWPPSGLWGVSLDPGTYYIVVDGFSGGEGSFEISVSESVLMQGAEAPEMRYSVNYESEKSNIDISIDDWVWADGSLFSTRDLLNYSIYRDDSFLASVSPDILEYDDNDVINLTEYCYDVRAVYEEGEAGASNIACVTPIPGIAPSGLAVNGGAGGINLEWTAGSPDLLEYNIYRDDQLLISTQDILHLDEDAEPNLEYCYFVTATYPSGESLPSNTDCDFWELYEPDDLIAEPGDGVVHLEWGEPTGGPDPGDECEDCEVVIGDGSCGYDCMMQCVDAWYLENWVGDGICDAGGWGLYFDCEFFECDGGDCLEADGTCGDGVVVYNSDVDPYNDPILLDRSIKEPYSVPENSRHQSRDLTGYDIIKDSLFLTSVGPDVYEYDDMDVINLTEYCYQVVATYDEGNSMPTDEECAIPIPGDAPVDLFAIAEGGEIHLTWLGGSPELIEYNVYRNGDLFSTTTNQEYYDDSAEHDVEYCYVVTGMYPSGESLPSNEACGMWVLAAPLGLTTTPGNGFIELNWSEPGTNQCADGVITSLPFSDINSNFGLTDDWLVQGSQGADFSYMFVVGSPIVIDITLCGPGTDYDTKLEVFTADAECNETTTGYYIDDATCEFSSLYSSLFGVSLSPGTYFIVVDGYAGSEGNFEINVTQSGLVNTAEPITIDESIAYESEKTGRLLNVENWIYADGTQFSGQSVEVENRQLTNFEIYRDDNLIEIVYSDVYSYMDSGLENGTEYCYFLKAIYDEGPSQPTTEVCDAPDAGPMCPPEDLSVNDEVGQSYIGLDWNSPAGDCAGDGGGNGGGDVSIGNECATDTDTTGFIDCIGFCFDQAYLSWIGDGWCDDGSYGIDFLCDEWDWDNGDCDGDGIGEGEKNIVESPGPIVYDMRDRLEGYNLYKDNELVTFTQETFYTDFEIVFDQEYCYKVKAVYEDGESNPTETVCGLVPDPAGYSVMETEAMQINAGESFVLEVSMNNLVPIAGFQFTLDDFPDLLEVITVEGTDRIGDFLLESNVQEDGSVIIIGFDVQGLPMEIGEGAILEISMTSSYVLSPADVNLIFSEVYVGDPQGNQIPFFTNSGIITLVPEGAAEISIESGELDTGEQIDLDLSLVNESPVGGFQVYIKDTPDVVSFVDFMATERTSGFIVNANEIDNDLILIGFGDVIEPGDGPILVLTFEGNISGQADLEIYEVVLTDPNDNQMPVLAQGGSLLVTTVVAMNIEVNAMAQNLVSFNVIPDLENIEAITSGTDIIIVSNDNAQFYIPNFNVNQIGALDYTDGYRVFIDGSQNQVVSIAGQPVDPGMTIDLEPYKINILPFLPLSGMSALEAFEGFDDDILLVKNDQGQYYIPSVSIMSLTYLSPGEAYLVYLAGNENLQYHYPTTSLSKYMDLSIYEQGYEQSLPLFYEKINTGISHPIIITNIAGEVSVGDELAAYAGGEYVGAVRIYDLNEPLLLAAAGGYNSYDVNLPGYEPGQDIELRLWSKKRNKELFVIADLDNLQYGASPMSMGEIVIQNLDAVPLKYSLGQNYPNPFNPNTSIDFAMPEDSYINLSIYDIMGRHVKTLIDGKYSAGYHRVLWDGKDADSVQVAASLYIYVLKNNKITITKKMVMMK